MVRARRDAEPLVLVTADGVRLSSLAYGPVDADVAIVFGHGFTGSQRNPKVVGLARHLGGRFAFYTADFRGHGASGGHSTLGAREVDDLECMLAVARELHPTVVSVGASMGGFTALRHAGLGGLVDAVVSISSPAVSGHPQMMRARLLSRAVQTRRGRRLLDLYGTRVGPFESSVTPPLDLVGAIAPTPVGIIHGARDRYVPVRDAYALFDRLGDPRRLVVLPRFGHAEAGFDGDFATVLEDLVVDLLARR
jgi:pimeloyl-ACP methyl ester carboxylesterase